MTVEELQKLHPNDPRMQSQARINRSRNYIRFRVSKEWDVDYHHHPLLTEEERKFLQEYHKAKESLVRAKVQFFSTFYENCPKVGSTLKRKEHKVEVIDNNYIPQADELDWL